MNFSSSFIFSLFSSSPSSLSPSSSSFSYICSEALVQKQNTLRGNTTRSKAPFSSKSCSSNPWGQISAFVCNGLFIGHQQWQHSTCLPALLLLLHFFRLFFFFFHFHFLPPVHSDTITHSHSVSLVVMLTGYSLSLSLSLLTTTANLYFA